MSNAPIIHTETAKLNASGEGTVEVTYFGYRFEVRAKQFPNVDTLSLNGLTKGLKNAKKGK